MVLQAQQIVARAAQIAKAPKYLSQAGQSLNAVLRELAETYNLEACLRASTIILSSAIGSGPYPLPDDYLRAARDGFFYFVDGTQYLLISLDLSEFDQEVQISGINSFPLNFATDVSRSEANNFLPVAYVWPPSGGSYSATLRYYSVPPDIDTPETSTVVPWFPFQNYLIRRVAGELMQDTADARADTYLGNGPSGAQGMLDRYLKLQEDDNGRAKRIQKDRRFHGRRSDRLPPSKLYGW